MERNLESCAGLKKNHGVGKYVHKIGWNSRPNGPGLKFVGNKDDTSDDGATRIMSMKLQKSNRFKISGARTLVLMLSLPLFGSCQYMDNVEGKAKKIVLYEKAALNLSKENRALQAKVSDLEFKIRELEGKNTFLEIKLSSLAPEGERHPSSVESKSIVADVENDLVKDSVFNWDPAQLLSVAETEMKKKNYEKSAQFYRTLIQKYPSAKSVDDQVFLQAAIAAYNTTKHYPWTQEYLDHLLSTYPTSPFFRAAKLYKGLTFQKTGNEPEFYQIVEEFRLKYRNTPEWKIVSAHYEEFLKQHK